MVLCSWRQLAAPKISNHLQINTASCPRKPVFYGRMHNTFLSHVLSISFFIYLFCFWYSFVKLQKTTVTFVISVCPSVHPSTCNSSAPTERIFKKYNSWVFFRKSVDNIQVSFKFDKNNVYCTVLYCIVLYCTWKPIYICDHTSLNCS
jgi:hypothetical protein